MICFRFVWLGCCIFMITLSYSVTAAIDENLITTAESGDTKAQIELSIAYQEENKFKESHYWLVRAAIQGDAEATVLLGHLFESTDSQNFQSLPIAENWYLAGSNNNIAEAELGYARVLESQFNSRKSKQLSSITVLDDQIDQDIQQSITSASESTNHNKNRINSDIIFTFIILISVIAYGSIKRLLTRRRGVKKTQLDNQLHHQSKKIKSLQRHLTAAHSQLKQNQIEIKKTNVDHSTMLACAVLGYHPGHLPSEKDIKLRYKKLSRIYHPDTNGSDEEMKRLNSAIKVISTYLKQRQRQ